MAYNSIPGGLESDSDDSDDLYFAGDLEKPKKITLWDLMKDKPRPDYVEVDWTTAVEPKVPLRGLVNLKTVIKDASEDEDTEEVSEEFKSSAPLSEYEDSIVFLDKLRVSAINGNLDYIKKYLPKVGVDIKLKNGWSCLQWAASAAQPEVVLFCLENGADPNQHKANTTVLMNAVLASTDSAIDVNHAKELAIVECIHHLIAHGARIDERDIVGTTALSFAAKKNRSKVVTALIDHGANMDQGDQWLYCPIHVAAAFGGGAMIELLVKSGAKFDGKTIDDETVANVAFKKDHDDLGLLLDELLEEGKLTPEMSKQLQRFKPFLHSAWNVDSEDFDTKQANDDLNSDALDSRVPNYEQSSQQRQHQLRKSSGKVDTDIENRLYTIHLSEFLYAHDMKDLEPLFKEKNLNFLDILFFEDSDFEELGLSPKERRRILAGLKLFHTTPWQKISLPNLRAKKVDHFDVANFFGHLTSQLNYTHASFSYLRREICKEKDDQEEFEKKKVQVMNVINDIDDCLQNLDAVEDVICDFDEMMNRWTRTGRFSEVNMITPDLIRDTQKKKPKYLIDDDDLLCDTIDGADAKIRHKWLSKFLLSFAALSIGSLIVFKTLRR